MSREAAHPNGGFEHMGCRCAGCCPRREYSSVTELPPTTACKHRVHDCHKCGTASRHDALHTTKNGRGVVAKLKAKK